MKQKWKGKEIKIIVEIDFKLARMLYLLFAFSISAIEISSWIRWIYNTLINKISAEIEYMTLWSIKYLFIFNETSVEVFWGEYVTEPVHRSSVCCRSPPLVQLSVYSGTEKRGSGSVEQLQDLRNYSRISCLFVQVYLVPSKLEREDHDLWNNFRICRETSFWYQRLIAVLDKARCKI